MNIFTQEELQAAKNYKYSGTDDSLLVKYVFRHFWNWLVEKFPMWLAPNVITFTGFLLEVISFTVSFIASDCMTQDPCPAVCIFNGVCLLIYQTLDNLDGKQARRTGSSSPLGQFFDHGCDAITGCLELMKVAMVVCLGPSRETYYFVALMAIGFLLTSWEEYITHKFYLGYLNGPDEGLFILGVVQILSGFFPIVKQICCNIYTHIGFLICFSITIGLILYDVYKEIRNDDALAARAFISATPLIITFSLFEANHYNVLQFNAYITPYFIMLCGLMLQYNGQLLIVAILTGRTPVKLFSPVVILEWIALALPLMPLGISFTDFYWFVFFWVHLAVMLITDIRVVFGLSTGLGIPIFTIKPQQQAPAHEIPEIVNIDDDVPEENFQIDEELLKEKEDNSDENQEGINNDTETRL